LITTVAAGLGLALTMGFLAIRLKLPVLVGYSVAGIIIGPATPGFVADAELSHQLAEIGVILWMFRVGRRIGRALAERGISYVVAEQNREIVERLRESGVPAVSGDASEADVLIQAHIHRARMLVIATPDTIGVRRMVEIARTVNPRIEAVVRTHSEEEAALLEKDAAGKVFFGEHELARAMVGHVFERYLDRKP
jgi:voltage-gated potassium channel Kch